MKIIKYDATMRIEAIKLATQGRTLLEIAVLLGIHRNTLRSWRTKDVKLATIMDEARKEGMQHIIDKGLTQLATGSKREEQTDEYETSKTINGKEIPVKRKVRTIVDAPSAKALEILARRYAKEYTQDEVEITHNTMNINTSAMSLREVQDAMRKSPIEAVSQGDDE
jgi:transposase-like protein